MIREVYQAINDPGGLREQIRESRKELSEIKDSLVGTLEKPGLIPNFKDHVEDHVRERNRIIVVFSLLATMVGSGVSYMIDYFFHR
jgi:hypothetical protein